MSNATPLLSHAELLQLKRWNTPTIYNGWEQITECDSGREGFNLEETRDFIPQMGPMVGHAVTVQIQPGNAETPKDVWADYYDFVAGVPGPKIVVIENLDKSQTYGSFWGEVSANIHRALGCVGTITDGAIRDVDEMNNARFKGISRRLCVGHAYDRPVRWGGEVEVFGSRISTGDLVHADKHGFLAIPPEDQTKMIQAANFMDRNECETVIDSARSQTGCPTEEIVSGFLNACAKFNEHAASEFGRSGEW